MLIDDFCDKYDISSDCIHIAKHHKKIPARVFSKFDGKRNAIDENYFVKRVEYKKKVQNFNQDFYYLLIESTTETEMAKEIKKMGGGSHRGSISYFQYALWIGSTKSILFQNVTELDIKFYKMGRRFMRNLNKEYKKGVQFDSVVRVIRPYIESPITIAEILDRRMNEA